MHPNEDDFHRDSIITDMSARNLPINNLQGYNTPYRSHCQAIAVYSYGFTNHNCNRYRSLNRLLAVEDPPGGPLPYQPNTEPCYGSVKQARSTSLSDSYKKKRRERPLEKASKPLILQAFWHFFEAKVIHATRENDSRHT